MHGTFFVQLHRYLEETYGSSVWDDVMKEATVEGRKSFFMLSTYPDDESLEFIEASSKLTGLSRSTLLDDFGRFLAKYLLKSYSIMIKPSWKTLDVIEHIHQCFKQLTSVEGSGFSPGELRIERNGPYEIVIHYNNSSQLCDLLIGIFHGFADYYHEAITIEHPVCMHQGVGSCEIVISKIPAKQLLMKLREQSQQKKEEPEPNTKTEI